MDVWSVIPSFIVSFIDYRKFISSFPTKKSKCGGPSLSALARIIFLDRMAKPSHHRPTSSNIVQNGWQNQTNNYTQHCWDLLDEMLRWFGEGFRSFTSTRIVEIINLVIVSTKKVRFSTSVLRRTLQQHSIKFYLYGSQHWNVKYSKLKVLVLFKAVSKTIIK